VNVPLRLLLTVAAWAAGPLAPLPASAKPATEAAPYRITMLLFRGCEEACRGFQAYFRQHGIAAEFTLRDAAQDKRRVAGFVDEIHRDKPDLIVTWGTTVTQEAVGDWRRVDPQRHITDRPVLFMIVSDPVAAGIVPALSRPRRNVSGTLYLLPVETQIKAARSYLDFKRIGYILNETESNSVSTRDELRGLAASHGFTLVERRLPVSPSGTPDGNALPVLVDELAREKVDLLYQGPDSFLNSRRDALTDGALARGLPVFAAAEAPVQQSRALFGVVNKYEDVGRFTAAQAVRILRDKASPADIPVTLPRNFSYLINLPVALQLGRYPPLKLLDVAEIVGIDSGEH
jgi:putative ABC transport system substrate-binding protein